MKKNILAIAIYVLFSLFYWKASPYVFQSLRNTQWGEFFGFLSIAFAVGLVPTIIVAISSNWISALRKAPIFLICSWLLSSLFGIVFLAFIEVGVADFYNPQRHLASSIASTVANMLNFGFRIYDALFVLKLMVPVAIVSAISDIIANRFLFRKNAA